MISVITPSHDSQYLDQVHTSLRAQTHSDWEWVIVLNRGAQYEPKISDARIKVQTAKNIPGIGGLKNYAFSLAQGDWLVELDHDDYLAPNALERVAATDGDFCYSDFANFRQDGTCEVYGQEYGWDAYEVNYGDSTYTAMRAFDMTPGGLQAIHFAPNHLRAWKKELYEKLGGHDVDLEVCDDYDLVCRTYLSGAKCVHLKECLYFYQLQPNAQNTYIKRNAEIQIVQRRLALKYFESIALEWASREGLLTLDLGAAHNPKAGYKSVDIAGGADFIVDLSKSLPWETGTVGVIRAYDFLEHIPRCPDSKCIHEGCTVGLMNELYRVLAPGGVLLTNTPSTDGRGAYQDPTHVSFWNSNSFWYYTRYAQARFVPGIKAAFQMFHVENWFPSDWEKVHNIVYVKAWLIALKGQRAAGVKEVEPNL